MSRKRREWRRAVRLRIAAEAIRRETIELAMSRALDLKRRGYTSCPRCGEQWLAPATPEGGPLVPVQLDACPRCGAKDPDAVRRDQKYQAELDAAHARVRLHGKRKMRRLAAAMWFDRLEADGHPVAVRALETDAAAWVEVRASGAGADGVVMDIDLSNSDMSRLTTMLTNAGAPFARGYAAGGERSIEVGTTEFYFDKEGALVRVKIPQSAEDRREPRE